MKMMVKLAVLLTTLLLLTGIAFAETPCSCYEITCTNLDIDMEVPDHLVELCFDTYKDRGQFMGLCDSMGEMSLFFDSMKKEALAYSENNPYGYLKFHGDDLHVVTGIGYCAGFRWELRGHKVDRDLCRER